jgi:hypothetical protein
MKKIILSILILGSLQQASAQKLFKGAGVFGALTMSKHEYRNLDTDKKDTSYTFQHFYPQTHISKEFFNWGAGVFLELSRRDKIRWQTELAYMNKGASERAILDPFIGLREDVFRPTKLSYLQWNNYLKFYNRLFYSSHWYFMAGIRLEYLLTRSAYAYPDVIVAFPRLWFSGDLGLGYEFSVTERIGVFVETHWNPDIIPHKYGENTRVRARTFEARVGLTYRPKKRRIDDCNAPVYRGPAY